MRWYSVAVLAAGLGACGLIDESVDDFSLALPEKEFRVDSEMFGLEVAGNFPSVACPDIDCAGMSSNFCSSSTCAVTCGSMGTCQASATITLYQMINMAMERPELSTIDKQSGIDVTIEEITFQIDMNSFDPAHEVPPLQVYVGPITAVDPSNADAHPIGVIAAVPGGYVGPGQLDFNAGGKEMLEEYMSEYTVPFNLMVSGQVVVEANETVPEGMMVGRVTGRARADAI